MSTSPSAAAEAANAPWPERESNSDDLFENSVVSDETWEMMSRRPNS